MTKNINDSVIGRFHVGLLKQPSVYAGDIPLCSFHDGENVIGKLWAKCGVLTFEGNVEDSARIFLAEVTRLYGFHVQEIEQRYQAAFERAASTFDYILQPGGGTVGDAIRQMAKEAKESKE